MSSGTRARIFSICGGTKWIIRSRRIGNSRNGAGAPMASGLKKLRGSFMRRSVCQGLFAKTRVDDVEGIERLAVGRDGMLNGSARQAVFGANGTGQQRGLKHVAAHQTGLRRC